MLREDLSGRFDYLFESLEVDESAGDGDDAATHDVPQPQDEGRWSRRIVLTGVVLATLAAAAATAVVLLQPALPAQPVITPTDTTPLSTPVATAPPSEPSITTEPPVAVLPATVSTSIPRPPSPPTVAPSPPPAQPSSTVASPPPATMPPPPTTRAPMSVSPETRTPFPNENPPRRNDDGGGLLGGLL